MDAITVLKSSFIITNVICSLTASLFLFFAPKDVEPHKKTALRYFVLFFIGFGLGFGTMIMRNWLPVGISVVLNNLFYLLVCYCLLYGLRWWYGEQQHLFHSPLAISHLIGYVSIQLYLYLDIPNSFDLRVTFAFLNYIPLFALSLLLTIRKSQLRGNGDRIIAAAITIGILLLLIPYGVNIGWHDTLLYQSSVMVAQNTLLLVMLGAFFSLFLFDKLEYHYESSITDDLTGLHNRRHFMDMLNSFHSDNDCNSTKAGLVICDIDNFKRINDCYGHHAGDEVLKAFARCLQTNLPDDTLIARYGGEEFTILLPGQSADDAREVAEQLRNQIAQLSITTEEGSLTVTASFGVTETGYQELPGKVIQSADKALYEAKNAGRDQVQVAC